MATSQQKAARDKPMLTDVDKFNALMSISSLSKALANEIVVKKSKKGGTKSATKKSLDPSTKF